MRRVTHLTKQRPKGPPFQFPGGICRVVETVIQSPRGHGRGLGANLFGRLSHWLHSA